MKPTEALTQLAQYIGRGEIRAVSEPAETRYKRYRVWTYTFFLVYVSPAGRPVAAPSRTFRSWSLAAAQRGVQSLQPQALLPPHQRGGLIDEATAQLLLRQLGGVA